MVLFSVQRHRCFFTLAFLSFRYTSLSRWEKSTYIKSPRTVFVTYDARECVVDVGVLRVVFSSIGYVYVFNLSQNPMTKNPSSFACGSKGG